MNFIFTTSESSYLSVKIVVVAISIGLIGFIECSNFNLYLKSRLGKSKDGMAKFPISNSLK